MHKVVSERVIDQKNMQKVVRGVVGLYSKITFFVVI